MITRKRFTTAEETLNMLRPRKCSGRHVLQLSRRYGRITHPRLAFTQTALLLRVFLRRALLLLFSSGAKPLPPTTPACRPLQTPFIGRTLVDSRDLVVCVGSEGAVFPVVSRPRGPIHPVPLLHISCSGLIPLLRISPRRTWYLNRLCGLPRALTDAESCKVIRCGDELHGASQHGV